MLRLSGRTRAIFLNSFWLEYQPIFLTFSSLNNTRFGYWSSSSPTLSPAHHSFLVGFLCPLMWYYATYLFFRNHYRKDPRERTGLAASTIAAMACFVVLLITVVFLLLST